MAVNTKGYGTYFHGQRAPGFSGASHIAPAGKGYSITPEYTAYKKKIGQWQTDKETFYKQERERATGQEAAAKAAVEEAKQKSEASKASALGYYQPIQEGLAEMPGELITDEQQQRMVGERTAALGAYGQNLTGMYGDASSGVQGGIRREIGMGIAGKQANLPIELELDVAGRNREAQLGLYGAKAGVAGGMAGVQMGYQYDPGMEYIKALGYSQGVKGV